MVSFEQPDDSDATLEWMTARAEVCLQRLGLPYRVKLMATGDMGFTQAKKYDLEVWAPGVEDWLEVSSVSNFRDFQARRMNIRWRPEPGAKPEILHTLNGSGLALARTVAAILEIYQEPDGSVRVPDALRPRLGDRITAPRSLGWSRPDERIADVMRAGRLSPFPRALRLVTLAERPDLADALEAQGQSVLAGVPRARRGRRPALAPPARGVRGVPARAARRAGRDRRHGAQRATLLGRHAARPAERLGRPVRADRPRPAQRRARQHARRAPDRRRPRPARRASRRPDDRRVPRLRRRARLPLAHRLRPTDAQGTLPAGAHRVVRPLDA